ncbi:hypothetical protein EDD17DRAFT_1754418 [Pisolithus thermaeus]|nr:hypothetical protein EDD17DRAFT_1754418 [Pisolithus thermaeus]
MGANVPLCELRFELDALSPSKEKKEQERMVPQQQQEVDQKRRKQTLERAKVNHLSKQLQMRLRYARLKVEYGWQRQSLNEVENLYFHRSHLRTSRVPPPATVTKPHTTSTGDEKEDSLFASMLVDDPATSSQQTNSSSSPDRMLALQVSEPPTIEEVLDAPRSATIGQGQLPDTSSQPSQSQPNPAGPAQSANIDVQTQTPTLQGAQAASSSHSLPMFALSDPSILIRLAQLQSQALGVSQPQPQPQMIPPSEGQSLPIQSSGSISSIPPIQPGQNLPPHFSLLSPQPSHSTSQSSISPQPPSTLTPTQPSTPGPSPPPVLATQQQQQPSAPTPLLTLSYPTLSPMSFSFAPPSATPVSPPSPPLSPQPPTTSTTMPSSCSASTPALTATSTSPLTYDSFWSTHISASGMTRPLYRTQAGFSASTNSTGHVAMLTPGGHTGVMTQEGVYVGGATAGSAGV